MKYIHIGYPKNLSTTIQRDYFDKHPNILHLGVGNGSNVDYIDSNINLVCEEFLQYSKDFLYYENRSFIKTSFDKWFRKFYDLNDKKAIGISLELLSFSWTPDQVDTTTKAKRIFDIFGSDTKIIIIIRNQFDLLKSLYREAVKLGYFGVFNDFIKYTYKYQDRNFLYDFLYHNIVSLYIEYFGKNNICVIPIEKVRKSNGELIVDKNNKILLFKELSDILKLDYHNITLNHHNEPLSPEVLKIKSQLNKSHRHDLGNPIFDNGVNSHRLKYYFNNFLNLNLSEDEIYNDVKTKRKLLKLSAKQEKNTMDYSCDYNYLNKLEELFINSNNKLVKLIDSDLPENYLI